MKLLSQLLKYVGENPSDGEVQDLMSEVDPSSSGHFKFPDFLSMMLRKMDENMIMIMTILFSRMVMVSLIDKNLVL